MAKNRKRVQSKSATGTVRQRQLLSSSVCRVHGIEAVTTRNTGEGTYLHVCSVCYLVPEKLTVPQNITGGQLLHLLTRGK